MKKKRILILSPGPSFKIVDAKFRKLSTQYAGDIITTSTYDEIINIESVFDFKYNCYKYYKLGSIVVSILFFYHCIVFAIKCSIEKDKYDFVRTYDPLKTGIVGVFVAKILGTKLIVEVNGVYDSPAEYMDGSNKFSIKIKKYIYPAIERFVLKRSQGIKLLFKGQIDSFSSVLDGKIIKSFSNLVDIDRFLEFNSQEEKQVLFVGFPFKRKGVDILIAAFKKIASDFPDWKLKILGWYPDVDELLSCIDGHPQVFYHPPVEPDDMPKHLSQCSILVLPSRSEAMGRVLIEAMAAGKPRIGANVDGIPTVINDGVDGLLFEPENSYDLAQKMSTLMKDDNLRRNLGLSGRRRVKEEFTEETYFKHLFSFYDEVISLK